MSTKLKKASTFALKIFAVLLALEIFFRLCGIPPKKNAINPEGPFQADPVLGWMFKSNFKGYWSGAKFETNAEGLRGPKLPKDGDESEYRILVLAGSTATGVFVDQNVTYVQQLENRLRDKEKNIHVLNAGIPGYSTVQELNYLKRMSTPLKPDFVILDFALNDVLEGRIPEGTPPSHERSIFRAEDAFLRVGPEPSLPGRLTEWMEDVPKQTSWYTVLRWPIMKLRSKWQGHGDGHRQIEHEVLDDDGSLKLIQAWDQTKNELKEIADLAKAQKIPLLITMFPISKQLDEPTLNRPQQIMTAFCQENRIPFLDLLPIFSSKHVSQPETKLFFDADHPTPIGHRLAADALAEKILPLMR